MNNANVLFINRAKDDEDEKREKWEAGEEGEEGKKETREWERTVALANEKSKREKKI